MILGIGLDIIEIKRMAKALKRQNFIKRVFTLDEQLYCDSRGAGRVKSYAVRFAAKEAVFKSFGVGLSKGTWQDVCVIINEKGQPHIDLNGYFKKLAYEKNFLKIFVSLTHSREYALAKVILWGETIHENCIF